LAKNRPKKTRNSYRKWNLEVLEQPEIRAEVPEDVLLIFRETTAAEINNKMSAILLPRQNQTPI
jgi:hypothetical protein